MFENFDFIWLIVLVAIIAAVVLLMRHRRKPSTQAVGQGEEDHVIPMLDAPEEYVEETQ